MANLFYHRMLEGFPQGLYSAVSFAAGYSKRTFVLTTTDRDDHIIIDPSDGMDLSFPDLPLLNEQGLGPRIENVHIVSFNHNRSWEDNLRENRRVIDKLRDFHFESLFPFTGKSTICHHLAETLDIHIRTADVETTYWAEDKKTLLGMKEITSIPRGYKVENNSELLESFKRLTLERGYPGTAVVKSAQSASGTVSSLIKSEEHLNSYISLFDLGELDGGVIEEWYESDIRSPSINYFIYPDGRSKLLFISNQIFEDDEIEYGREGTRIYRGNIFPTDFDDDMKEKIIENTEPIVEMLYGGGYWGPVGFDTIVVEGNENFVTEINPRVTGPHFGWRPMKNLGLSCFQMQNEKINPEIDFDGLRKELEDILFFKGKSGGYIVFNFFPGKFIGLTLGSSIEEIREIKREADRILRKLKGSR